MQIGAEQIGSCASLNAGGVSLTIPDSGIAFVASERSAKETLACGYYAVYAIAVVLAITIWLLPIHSPLWLDETGSYWQISDGLSHIWSRQVDSFAAYSYILWLSTKVFGTSEFALRIPSFLAMVAAVYLLYRVANELFNRELAMIAAIVFCVNPLVKFASIDVRPYAFGLLAINAAILILLRLSHGRSNWLAALFGFSAAGIIYFHYLFATILPGLVISWFLLRNRTVRHLWRQLGIAAVAFALALVPVVPGLLSVFRTSKTHIIEPAPKLAYLLWTLAPGWLLPAFVAIGFVAFLVVASKIKVDDSRAYFEGRNFLVSLSIALIPLLILFTVSTGTRIHVFVPRYRLAAIPGLALCWAFIAGRIRPPALRLILCALLVIGSIYECFTSPNPWQHDYTWKYALALAQKNASTDNAPVMICSEFIESNYDPMPLKSPKDSFLLAPLSYYKLNVPVVPLPREFNSETMRVGSQFLQQAGQKHERFLAMAHTPSYKTLDWLSQVASGAYSVSKLGVYDNIEVLEFSPRMQTGNK